MIIIACGAPFHASYSSPVHLDRIKMPEGFKISLYASNIPDARSMARGSEGTLFVGNRQADKVWAVVDSNNDNVADKSVIILRGLTSPNGVAFLENDLYVAERSRILKFPDIESSIDQPPAPEVIYDDLPKKRAHGWKYIAFSPDNYLYVPVGAPCNVCLRTDPRFASITRMKPDGSDFSVYAQGVRNTVGFDWHPETGVLWFTDNGRDWMGDNIPPDELNRAPHPGMHFGFPFCHGGDIPDPKYGKKRPCTEFTPPAIKLGPHVAALGMKFYTGTMFPSPYHNQIFVAEHGSWNRSSKIGYRITLVRIENREAVSYDVFAEGWMQNEVAWGRPVDILVMPDGSLLVSDDYAGVIYRIEYAPSS
ncbi:MAG: sorbosone dehydrogenase family protein [Chitinivibrionales bacterium]|nr:sorbosone dehydrogenase family protein [Chitinivibrionales bacterium]